MLVAGVVRYRTLMARNAPPVAVAMVTAEPPPVEAAPPPRGVAREERDRDEARPQAPSPDPVEAPAAPAPSSEPEAQPSARPAPTAVSIEGVGVVVYTTSWCSVCKRAKSWMNQKGIAYDERDIESSTDYAREMRALNPRGSIPTFDVEGTVLVGFSENGLTAAMQHVARLRAERRNY